MYVYYQNIPNILWC